MQDLTIQTLPAVPHIVFGIFNLAVPNLIIWCVAIVSFFVGCWARMPNFMERGRTRKAKENHE